jgi:hypothetical protein
MPVAGRISTISHLTVNLQLLRHRLPASTNSLNSFDTRILPDYPTSSRLALFKPLVSVLQSDPALKPRLLIHFFSNGGALGLVDLCTIFKLETGHILAIQAIVLDSSPGYPNFRENWNAISMVLPKFPMSYYPSATLLVVILGWVWIRVNVLGLSMLANSTGGKINDVGLVDGEAKRIYVYSTIDALCWVERCGKAC